MFSESSSAKSPRIVPGAESSGFVVPIMVRTTEIADSPLTASARTGPELMKSTSPLEEGLPGVLRIVLAAHRLRNLEQPRTLELEPASLESREDLAGKASLHTVGLDENQCRLSGHLFRQLPALARSRQA